MDPLPIRRHDSTSRPARSREQLVQGGCRDLDRATRDLEGVTPADVLEKAEATATTVAIPEADDRRVFELAGLDCRTCAGFVEAGLERLAPVSNVTASHRYGSVRVDFDPDAIDSDQLVEELVTLGYPVETTDEAFANRRAAQWADARFAAGILAGLMVLAPYAGVIYPTRFAAWPTDPAVVALLERALTSVFATHFFLNIALLTAIVLLFTGKPILDDARKAVGARVPDRNLLVACLAIGIYAYSTVTAFWFAHGGGVYYDVVIALVVGVTIARQGGLWIPGDVESDDKSPSAGRRTLHGTTSTTTHPSSEETTRSD